MSRTHKDLKRSAPRVGRKKEEPFKRNYLRFKRHGPRDPGDLCPDCGGLTDFQSGFLVCSECGWHDGGLSAVDEFEGIA